MDLQMLKQMVDCHFWANYVMLDSLAQFSQEQYTRTVESSFPSIQATVRHMLNSELFLLRNLTGADDLPSLAAEEVATPAAARERWPEVERRWRQAIEELGETGLERGVTVRFSGGQEFALKAWQVIHQLLEHGPYHRGQVVTMARQVGGAPFKTDALLYHIMQGQKA